MLSFSHTMTLFYKLTYQTTSLSNKAMRGVEEKTWTWNLDLWTLSEAHAIGLSYIAISDLHKEPGSIKHKECASELAFCIEGPSEKCSDEVCKWLSPVSSSQTANRWCSVPITTDWCDSFLVWWLKLLGLFSHRTIDPLPLLCCLTHACAFVIKKVWLCRCENGHAHCAVCPATLRQGCIKTVILALGHVLE